MNLTAHQKSALLHIAAEVVAGIHNRTVGMSTTYVLHRHGLVRGLTETTRITEDGYRVAATLGFDLAGRCAHGLAHADRMLVSQPARADHWCTMRAYWIKLAKSAA